MSSGDAFAPRIETLVLSADEPSVVEVKRVGLRNPLGLDAVLNLPKHTALKGLLDRR